MMKYMHILKRNWKKIKKIKKGVMIIYEIYVNCTTAISLAVNSEAFIQSGKGFCAW